jgi:hypothetical protein
MVNSGFKMNVYGVLVNKIKVLLLCLVQNYSGFMRSLEILE